MANATISAPRPQRKPRPKPARSIRYLTTPLSAERPYGAVRIVCGSTTADYYLSELPAADGRGFALEKIALGTPAEEREHYHVFLHANGQDRSCECKGFCRWGHCKHADGLAILLG